MRADTEVKPLLLTPKSSYMYGHGLSTVFHSFVFRTGEYHPCFRLPNARIYRGPRASAHYWPHDGLNRALETTRTLEGSTSWFA